MTQRDNIVLLLRWGQRLTMEWVFQPNGGEVWDVEWVDMNGPVRRASNVLLTDALAEIVINYVDHDARMRAAAGREPRQDV